MERTRFRLSNYEWAVIAVAMAIEALVGMLVVWAFAGQALAGWVWAVLALAASIPGAVVLVFLFSLVGRGARIDRADRLINVLADTMISPRLLVDAGGRELWSNAVLRRRLSLDPMHPIADLERHVCTDEDARVRFNEAWKNSIRGAV